MRHIIAFTVIFTLFSCQRKQPQEQPVVQVFESMLYPSELSEFIPKGTSPEDSVIFAQNFVRNWVTQKLLLHKAIENLSFHPHSQGCILHHPQKCSQPEAIEEMVPLGQRRRPGQTGRLLPEQCQKIRPFQRPLDRSKIPAESHSRRPPGIVQRNIHTQEYRKGRQKQFLLFENQRIKKRTNHSTP